MDKESYLINQLAERAGVTVRTIRYYVNEGLLPSPQTKGRYSAYDDDYLYRIKLIKFYKESYLPLSRIRERLDEMSPEEIKAAVEKYEKEPPEFNLPPTPENFNRVEENLPARNYLRRIQEPSAADYHPESMAMSPAPQVNLHKIMPAPEPSHELSWKRIEVAEGIELLIREDIYRRRRQELEILLDRLGGWDREI
jgi:DNA-binding transcriptional MerR regulator